ncbi:MAG: patatin-like phospholipase family protein [Synergistaceae bacterium]|nr:patatin-like phospholipase family protein [Synergistaceae bacterium]MBQ3399447.1 patatin-like phospholipase family protein [Synergistaceae bacterium]MBQ6417102.1 patatin-like phospholipase family protein [Synergistaceae bacterium]MBQ6664373.1 patatin-like phospholipase family protein [Synergistaceae bacterium]MBR0249053.1 patatin-like phospholipase family protein [Synergistaceae bacterium]
MFKRSVYIFMAMVIMAMSPLQGDAGVVLVLSGGGVKGFAHLGVMETLELNGVPIVGIVGTSMGALMGALRASGYSTKDIHGILKELDLPSLLSENTGPMFVFTGNDRRAKTNTVSLLTYKKQGDQKGPKGLLTGDKLYTYFSQLMKHVTETDFYHLPIPYAAVATDINTGEKVVLKEGNLAAAMRASMSIPMVFEPWRIDDHLLVDGGIVSNLPVYTAKELFPGIPIVAVDISDNMGSKVNSYMDVLNQSLTILMRKTTDEEGQAADILLRPDVSGLGTLDNVDPEAVIALGVDATMPMIDEIKALSEKGPALFTLEEEERTLSDIVGDIEVHGLPPKMAELVRKRALRWIGKPVDQKKINEGLDRLSESVGIEMADYQLGRTASGDVLVRIDVRKSPEVKLGISGYTTNLHPNRWLYLKGEMNGLLSEYDSLIGVAKIGKQWGIDLTYQTAPQPMDGWQFTLSAQNWQPAGEEDHLRDWDRYAAGIARLFTLGEVNMGLGYAYEHVDGDAISAKDGTEASGITFFAEYDTLDMPSDPTRGYAWKINAWWPNFDEVNYRLSYFKPLEVSSLWRTYLRLGFAEGDMNRRSHAVYLGAAEELYSVASNPIEAERMFWANLAFRKILNRTAVGVLAGELFASWGYAMDKEWHKIEAPWEVGLAVNFPNNLIDMKLAIMYGSEELKTGFFLGVPIWDHYPLP